MINVKKCYIFIKFYLVWTSFENSVRVETSSAAEPPSASFVPPYIELTPSS